MSTSSFKRSFFGASLGTLVEYYDYSVLGIFLPLISPLFFPAETAYDSLVKGFYALLVAMITRPIGGLFFGYLGDKYGRRKALLCSMYGIAIATIIMGLSPTYYSIGIWASVLMVATKSVQVFCFGGEYNGASIYVIEHAQNKKESFYSSAITAIMLAGSLVASLIAYLTTLDGMPSWSWRIAFVLGGVIGIAGILYRKNLEESPQFSPAKPQEHSFKNLIKNYPIELIAGVFMGGFSTLVFTTVLFFMNPVLMTKGLFTKQTLMLLQSMLIVVAIIALLTVGKMADKSSPHRMMRMGALLVMLFAWPLLWIADQGVIVNIIMIQCALIIMNEMVLGPSNVFLKNCFPAPFRYRGASLSFTIGLSLIGGLTPVVENYLYKNTGQFSSISLWLIFIATGTFVFVKWAHKRMQNTQPLLRDTIGQPEMIN